MGFKDLNGFFPECYIIQINYDFANYPYDTFSHSFPGGFNGFEAESELAVAQISYRVYEVGNPSQVNGWCFAVFGFYPSPDFMFGNCEACFCIKAKHAC